MHFSNPVTDENIVEDIEKISKTTLCFDTKWMKFSNASQKDKSKMGKEILTLIAAGHKDANDIPIAACATEIDNAGSEKSALSCANTIQKIFQKLVPDEEKRQEIYDKIIAFCFDTTGFFGYYMYVLTFKKLRVLFFVTFFVIFTMTKIVTRCDYYNQFL